MTPIHLPMLPTYKYRKTNRQVDRVGFNAALDTLQVTSEMIFPINHLASTSKQNQTTTRL